MDASTTTTIRGVSIFSRQRRHKADIFDMALSAEGIAIQRPGRMEQHMLWDRISQWEIEERPGCVVLTLRGDGSVTPLMITGWTLEDLEAVMRQATGAAAPEVQADGEAAPATVPTMPAAPMPAPAPDETAETETAETETAETNTETGTAAPALPPSRVERRLAAEAAAATAQRPPRNMGKVLVTVVALGVLATAVVVVLLQSAGVIDWSFLGPVA